MLRCLLPLVHPCLLLNINAFFLSGICHYTKNSPLYCGYVSCSCSFSFHPVQLCGLGTFDLLKYTETNSVCVVCVCLCVSVCVCVSISVSVRIFSPPPKPECSSNHHPQSMIIISVNVSVSEWVSECG